MYPNFIKKNRRLSTCNRLDLETLGSQPVMPKNLPDRCWGDLRSKNAYEFLIMNCVNSFVIFTLISTLISTIMNRKCKGPRMDRYES